MDITRLTYDIVHVHETVYEFSKTARSRIVDDFRRHARRVTENPNSDLEVCCTFDKQRGTFVLKCMGKYWPEADHALARVIRDYIEDEANDAQRENREPNYRRLAVSDANDLDIDKDFNAAEREEATTATAQLTHRARIQNFRDRQSITLHFVSTHGHDSSSVMFFNLRELGNNLLKRALTPAEGYDSVLKYGMTCRAVAWDKTREDWRFNGRVGQPLRDTRLSTDLVIHNAQFIEVNPTTINVSPTSSANVSPTSSIDPNVKKYMDSMKNIVPETPKYISDAWQDAAKSVSQPFLGPAGGPRSLTPVPTKVTSPSDRVNPEYSKYYQEGNKTDESAAESSGIARADSPTLPRSTPSHDEVDSQSDYERGQTQSNKQKRQTPQMAKKTKKEVNPQAVDTAHPSDAETAQGKPTNNHSAEGSDTSSSYGSVQGLDLDLRPTSAQGEDNGITRERLASEQARPDLKFTMKQQALKGGKKNNKAKGPNQEQLTANLPRPDPVPPPRATASSAKAKGEGVKKESPPPKAFIGITQLLEQTAARQGTGNTQVFVQFGIILLKHQQKPNNRIFGVQSPETMENKLNEAAPHLHVDFLPRMTTSSTDASAMLDIVDPETNIQTNVEYEIYVKTAENTHLTIVFDQERPGNCRIGYTDTLSTAYIHYPMRVFDAKIIVERVEIGTKYLKAAQEMALSLQSVVGDAPSSYMTVPSAFVAVEKCLAKRRFVKILEPGLELQVEEVQHLLLTQAEMRGFSLLARADSPANMAENSRLWWECSVRAGGVEGEGMERLGAVVEEIVKKIDSVGF